MEPFDIENLTIAQARQIATLFSPAAFGLLNGSVTIVECRK